RHSALFEQALGERLAALETRARGVRTEGAKPAPFESIDQAESERQLRPYHRQVDRILRRESTNSLDVVSSESDTSSDLGDAAVAGRAVEFADMGALADLPAERVLAPPAAHHEDLHATVRMLGFSMPEMPEPRQHDCHAVLVRCVDDLLIADAPTW